MAKIIEIEPQRRFVIEDVSQDELGLLTRGLYHDHTKASDAFNTCADRGCPCGGYDNIDEVDENDELYGTFSAFIDTMAAEEVPDEFVETVLGAFGIYVTGVDDEDDDLPF